MSRTPILLVAFAASLGCNAIFGVDDGVARSAGTGGKAATATSSSASSGTGGSSGCDPFAGTLNVTISGANGSNLVATSAMAQGDVSGFSDGVSTAIDAVVGLPTTCFSINLVFSDQPASTSKTFDLAMTNPPSIQDGFVQIDENDGECTEQPMTREWQSTGGTATMIAMGKTGVLVTLTNAEMTAVMDADHTGTGTFTVNGTFEADCFTGI